MSEQERIDLFRACVQSGAIVETMQSGRGFQVATDAIALAWTVPASALPDIAFRIGESAMEYIDWQMRGNDRPDWWLP